MKLLRDTVKVVNIRVEETTVSEAEVIMHNPSVFVFHEIYANHTLYKLTTKSNIAVRGYC